MKRALKPKTLILNERRDASLVTLSMALAWADLDGTERSTYERKAEVAIEAMRRNAGRRWP